MLEPELTDSQAPWKQRMGRVWLMDDQGHFGDRHKNVHARPLVTTADKIAAAVQYPGEITRQPMIILKDDESHEFDGKHCYLCPSGPKAIKEWFEVESFYWRENLEQFEVEWDPTIRF